MEKANQQTSPFSTAHIGPQNRTTAIFLISVLALFLELLLIRWIGTEINIFAYLQNTVLVVCFLGLGMGCFTCREPIILRNMLLPLLILVLLLSIPYTREILGMISLVLSTSEDLLVWHMGTVDSASKKLLSMSGGLIITFALMFVIWNIFVPIGRLMGRLIDDHPSPIWAYSVNIAGSLVGIWAFVALSVFNLPPAVWFLLAAALALFFIGPRSPERRMNLVLLLGIAALSWFAGRDGASREALWSPYQKLALYGMDQNQHPFARYLVKVNNTAYQWIVDLSEGENPIDGKFYRPEMRGFVQYDIPFLLHPNPETSLIVGAGTGNDVAGALRHGVKEITAVEIDPAIIYFGRKYHPEKPYDSPKVKLIHDDARSFFSTSSERYDVISFGLLDSHTTTAMTNARLDHYVYTKESLQRAQSLLKEHGIMALTFESQKPFISDRIARSLREIFGEEPIAFRIPSSVYAVGGVMFIAGDLQTVRKKIAANSTLSSLIEKWKEQSPLQLTYGTKITIDDWPYLYLDAPRIPLLYYFLAVMTLALFLYTKWRFKFGGLSNNWTISHWHFFFLGAAFLLLEVQNISKASVVLGNTWWVNAVIISGILVMILLANLIAAKFSKIPLWPVYLGLVGSCIALYFIDLARFGFLPYYEKAIIIGSLTALPVLFSGIVFIRSFASVTAKDMALGANLMGSLVGGLLQSVTFITGIKALLLIVAGLYCVAMLCSPYRRGALIR